MNEPPGPTINGCMVFSATMQRNRDDLGYKVTEWLRKRREEVESFVLLDYIVSQSSDAQFHCISIVIFFNEQLKAVEQVATRKRLQFSP